MDKIFNGKWSQKHGVIQPNKIPENFTYLAGIFQREGISLEKTQMCIQSFESEDREWPPTIGQIVSRCKISGEVKASNREIGVDFETVPWLGSKRVNPNKVSADLAKLRTKLRG